VIANKRANNFLGLIWRISSAVTSQTHMERRPGLIRMALVYH
jgi:hypothetical protein